MYIYMYMYIYIGFILHLWLDRYVPGAPQRGMVTHRGSVGSVHIRRSLLSVYVVCLCVCVFVYPVRGSVTRFPAHGKETRWPLHDILLISILYVKWLNRVGGEKVYTAQY